MAADKPEFTAYPFWTLSLPESLKQDLLKSIAKATNRSIDKVHLPVRVLNSAARMLIPNLIAIEQYAGRINTEPWLYGFVGMGTSYPASSMQSLFLSVLDKNNATAYYSTRHLRALAQQLTPDMLQWKRETMDLTRWTYAGNGHLPKTARLFRMKKGRATMALSSGPI